MPEEQTSVKLTETRWAIALDWFEVNHRSITALIGKYLCSGCAHRLSTKKKSGLQDFLGAIADCCSKNPDFINQKLPILESAFRIFLRNGNRPLTLNELSSELGRARSGDIFRSSPETLFRILKNDRFYGLQEFYG